MTPKNPKQAARAQVPMSEGVKQLIASIRNTSEWDGAGLGAQTRILAAERLIQELYAKDPTSITDEVLELLEIRRERANEIIGL